MDSCAGAGAFVLQQVQDSPAGAVGSAPQQLPSASATSQAAVGVASLHPVVVAQHAGTAAGLGAQHDGSASWPGTVGGAG